MAPKKNDEQTSAPNKTGPENLPKKRGRKPKPVKELKTPNLIKIKIPSSKKSQNSSPDVVSEPAVIKKRRLSPQGALLRKIELANEVALAQLVKPTVKEVPVAAPIEEPKKVKRGPKKAKETQAPKKKIMKPKIPKNVVADVSTEGTVPVQKPQKKVKKLTAKAVLQKDFDPKAKKQMKKADSTSKKSCKQTIGKQANINKNPGKIFKKRVKKIAEVTSTEIQSSPSILNRNMDTIEDEAVMETEMEQSTRKSPMPIDSRKTSTSECLSWTKDISSSSTTTCLTVGSNDFYRIDKKVPVIRLSHVDNKWRREPTDENNADDHSSSSDSEDVSKQTNCSSSDSNSSRSLDLSSESSYTHRGSLQSGATKEEVCKYALDKLKKFDMEFVNWIGHDEDNVDPEIKMIVDKMFKIFKEENEAMVYCRNVRKIFKPDANSPIKDLIETDVAESNNEILERANKEVTNTIDRSEDDEFTSSRGRYVMFDQNCEKEDDPLQEPRVVNENSEGDDNFAPDKVRYRTFESAPYNDDDDALSLFAESLTGIESTRLNSSASMSVAASDHEEYIPQCLSNDIATFERPVYNPTKITQDQNSRRLVCEKQNADSTYTEFDDVNRPQIENKIPNLPAFQVPVPTTFTQKLPSLLDPTYKAPPSIKSLVFRCICFYNLISKCKKARCSYPHKQIDENQVRNILHRLPPIQFIQEYMIMRNWPILRRKFGLLYVEECLSRELTGTLLEMCIDFVSKAKADSTEDLELKVNVLELTLLHLNLVNVIEYSDLLRHNFGQDILLCDVFMHTIAMTQNFSRFKLVFINMTNYVVSIGRTFRTDVASQILERVCILPSETPLAIAVLKILQNTDASLLKDPKMEKFEMHLRSLDKNLAEDLVRLKCQPVNPYRSPHLSQEDQLSVPHTDRDNRYTSPDTTKLDMNKSVEEPIIKRTINLPRMAFTPPFHNVRSKPGWRGFNYRHNNPRPPAPVKRHVMERHVAFGPPPKFPRRPV